ncbi:MAG TPA: HD-GYP domain-containing protein [Syntrophomonas sp.]|jgi:HD-GYP domain-containing protein (c-di-GMP phosphodiesterase class II)|nr:HD-GYP domain-containing protein [Syntrophomonas sp.]HCF71013.1 HD-GYP domain-containing protein [Syntrophomonas sp.]
MRKISLDYAHEGLFLGRSIIDSEGHILLRAGVELDEYYIDRLLDLGIHYIYIQDEIFGETDEIEDIISEETRITTVKMVKKTFNHLQQDRKINTAALRKIVNNMLDEILDNSNVLLGITDISSLNDYIFHHSVSVCTLSIMTGITLGYDDTHLLELGIGALLHDIGKSKIDPEIIKREGNLNEEEFALLSKHPQLGFDIMRNSIDLSLLSAHIAYQHHERWDGRGYPRGLSGNNIHEYARIVAVANIYDELMAERPNRPPFEVNQAINLIKRMSDIYFEPRIVKAMISNIATYPVGSIVQLNTGDIGIVTHLNNDAPHRPIIRIVFDADQRRLQHPHEIDLSKMTTVIPSQIMSERDLNKLLPLKMVE